VGKIADISSLTLGMYVFVACAAYLVFVSVYAYKKH
jgi:hypothetical protein